VVIRNKQYEFHRAIGANSDFKIKGLIFQKWIRKFCGLDRRIGMIKINVIEKHLSNSVP